MISIGIKIWSGKTWISEEESRQSRQQHGLDCLDSSSDFQVFQPLIAIDVWIVSTRRPISKFSNPLFQLLSGLSRLVVRFLPSFPTPYFNCCLDCLDSSSDFQVFQPLISIVVWIVSTRRPISKFSNPLLQMLSGLSRLVVRFPSFPTPYFNCCLDCLDSSSDFQVFQPLISIDVWIVSTRRSISKFSNPLLQMLSGLSRLVVRFPSFPTPYFN